MKRDRDVSQCDLQNLFNRTPVPPDLEHRIEQAVAAATQPRRPVRAWRWGAAAALIGGIYVGFYVTNAERDVPELVAALGRHVDAEALVTGMLDADHAAWAATQGIDDRVALSRAKLVKNCRIAGISMRHVRFDDAGHAIDLFFAPAEIAAVLNGGGAVAGRHWAKIPAAAGLSVVAIYQDRASRARIAALVAAISTQDVTIPG